jgi:hypothetical protein
VSRVAHHKAGAVWWAVFAPVGFLAVITLIGVFVGNPRGFAMAGALVCISGWLHGLITLHHCLNVSHLQRIAEPRPRAEGER